jgi:excreted virulence factor EspC (type VII ESX diderm)
VSGFHVEPEELRGYSGQLDRAVNHFSAIKQHASTKGADTSGFTGLLSLLVPIVDGVVNLYTDALQSGHDKLAKVKTNLDAAVTEYEKHDTNAKKNLDNIKTGAS